MLIISLFVWAMLILIYFVPSLIAGNKHKRNLGAIFALNLLLGWTLIGWVGALVWALCQDAPTVGEARI